MNKSPILDNSISPFKSRSGVSRIWSAGIYSYRGLKAAWLSEAAIRQELLLALVLIPLTLLLNVDAMRRLLMIASILLVLIVELLNSAIEAVVDRISLEPHELSGRAKDIGSAAVFIALVNVVITWTLALL